MRNKLPVGDNADALANARALPFAQSQVGPCGLNELLKHKIVGQQRVVDAREALFCDVQFNSPVGVSSRRVAEASGADRSARRGGSVA